MRLKKCCKSGPIGLKNVAGYSFKCRYCGRMTGRHQTIDGAIAEWNSVTKYEPLKCKFSSSQNKRKDNYED